MDFKLQKILALLLIRYGNKFNNSYDLTKVLSIKFDLINIVEIIDSLVFEDLIHAKYIEGVGYFELTENGMETIKSNLKAIKNLLVEKYPESIKLIEKLISEIKPPSSP